MPAWDAMDARGQTGSQLMPFVGLPGAVQAPGSEHERRVDRQAPGDREGARTAIAALMLLPGALIVFLGFNAGGYFPATPAIAAIVLTQVLLVRIVRSPRPFAGLAPVTGVAIVALGLYTAITLASALWSHATGRALIEFDRAWLYLVTLLLFGTVRAGSRDLRRLVRGLLLGISIVCLAGLSSRVLPNVWHTAPDVSNQRLSYPVTYWNTLGLLAALGIALALHLTCTLGERRMVRALAGGVLPLLAATLFFTFSRGAIAAGTIGVVVYVVSARPRGLIGGLLATLPPTAALVLAAYHANLLDTVDPTTPAAVDQGHHVALVAGICVFAAAGLRLLFAIWLDPSLRRWLSGAPRMSYTMRRVLLVAGVAVIVALGVALGSSHTVSGDWQRFMSGAPTQVKDGDLRQRLTDPSNDGRTDLWRVALAGFEASPAHGYGAGMYQTLWDRDRSTPAFVINAHSLYLQAMAELGLPGIVLLLTLVGTVLVGLAMRARGSRRSIYGALLAFWLIWAVRAGVDWDWEMPVVTLGVFAIAGAGLGPRVGEGLSWRPGGGARAGLVALGLASVVVPVLIIGSQTRLAQAEHALYASNCIAASTDAQASIGWLSGRPEPYEILGFCDLQRGLPRRAVAEMHAAVTRDPGSWETYYTLAIAQAAAGIDPRPAAARALAMSPLERLTREETGALRSARPTEWIARARALRIAALASNDLSTVPSS